MGLLATNYHHFEDFTKRFSDDVLCIELSGPEHHHFSVVDVPGLSYSMLNMSAFLNLTNIDIARSYTVPNPRGFRFHPSPTSEIYVGQAYDHSVGEPRLKSESALTGCSALMDARTNLANQEVFRMARTADPKGTRTVGIITKCDALQQEDEKMVSGSLLSVKIAFLTGQGHGNRSKQGRAPVPWLVRSPKQIDSRHAGRRHHATETLQ